MSDDVVVELLDRPVVVEVTADTPLTVQLDDPVAVELIAIGVPGPPGPSGGYTHTQGAAATTWTIPHNLGYRPAVQAFTAGGLSVWGTLAHLDDNTCTLTFAVAITGTARCA